jgi:hypothetical protein
MDDANSGMVEIWVEAEPDPAHSVKLGPTPSDLDPWNSGSGSQMTKVAVPRSQFAKSIREVEAFLGAIVDGVANTRVRLDEVEVSLSIENDGILKWALGAKVSGGATLKFKVEPRPR